MRNNFSRHNRNAAHCGDLFLLNQFQRFTSIPFVHVDQFAAAEGRAVGGTIIGGNMK